MILGAGLGTRLRPFTTRIPKPLIPVQGVPCIEFAMRSLADSGVRRIVVNIHAHASQMRKYLGSNPVGGVQVEISDEEPLLLGSGGGFRKALPRFNGHAFFSMNADVIHFLNLADLAGKHRELREKHGVAMTLVLASRKQADLQEGEYREIRVDSSSGLVLGLGEKKSKVPFYTGSAIFEPEAFEHLTEGNPAEFVPEILEPMMAKGKVGFLESDAIWLDVGSPELWVKADRELKKLFERGELTPSLMDRIRNEQPSWSQRFECKPDRIRLGDLEYEIKDLRNL